MYPVLVARYVAKARSDQMIVYIAHGFCICITDYSGRLMFLCSKIRICCGILLFGMCFFVYLMAAVSTDFARSLPGVSHSVKLIVP